MLHPQKHKNLTEVNGESSYFFWWYEIKTKTSQDYSTAIKVLLDVLNSYWLQKWMELNPYKKIGSNKLWDLREPWQPVSYWHCKSKTVK